MNTLPPFVDDVITSYFTGVSEIDAANVEGIYLIGSLALNDYHIGKSDIDFMTVLKERPSLGVVTSFGRLHADIEKQFRHAKMDGFYITQNGMREGQLWYPSFHEGKLIHARKFEPPRQIILELVENSIPIYGPQASELGFELTTSQVNSDLHSNLNYYWKNWVNDHRFPKMKFWKLYFTSTLSEWGVLGVARQLYTFETGKIASKIDAGKYLLLRAPEVFRKVINEACEARIKGRHSLQPSFKRATQTLACVRWVLNAFNNKFEEANK